jgi:mannose-6-phosphate isomerase-like protein (cupin superfamily)
MTAFNNRTIEEANAATSGGEGIYYRERFAEGEALGNAISTFARIIVPAGTRMGYHQHVGDFEFYYILKGEGEYNDNGTIVPCKPGDVFKCEDGGWHCIINNGSEDIEFVALIVKSV